MIDLAELPAFCMTFLASLAFTGSYLTGLGLSCDALRCNVYEARAQYQSEGILPRKTQRLESSLARIFILNQSQKYQYTSVTSVNHITPFSIFLNSDLLFESS